MINDESLLAAIRSRDADCGEDIPSHWTAQLDRRNLLRMLDNALHEIDRWYETRGIGW